MRVSTFITHLHTFVAVPLPPPPLRGVPRPARAPEPYGRRPPPNGLDPPHPGATHGVESRSIVLPEEQKNHSSGGVSTTLHRAGSENRHDPGRTSSADDYSDGARLQ